MNIFCTKTYELPGRLYNSFDASYLIVGLVAFSQGMQGIADLSIQYMFKDDFLLSPARMGLYMSYVTFPWVIKPVWGIFTDAKPLFGYRRKSYLILFGALGTLGWVLMAYYGLHDLYTALMLLLLIQLSTCFNNVVGEAILVEIAGKENQQAQMSEEQNNRAYQKGASRSVSLFFGLRALGALVSAYFSGALLGWVTKKEVFLITAIFPLTLMLVALLLNERKIDRSNPGDEGRINATQCMRDFWVFFQNPLIYKPVILIFCFMMAPSSGAIMFFFYTTELGFTPNFLGQLKFMYAVGTIVGVIMYNSCLRDIQFKKIFMTTTFLYYLCYQSMIILVTRKNVEWGINDKMFCIGDSIMLQLVGELNMMPLLVLSCKMCPKNIEGTMYAMLMSTMNMGSMLSAQWGALFLIYFKVNENDFSNLWLFIAVTGIFILLPLPWTYVIKEDEIMRQREIIARTDNNIVEGGLQVQNDKHVNENQIQGSNVNIEENEEKTPILIRNKED